MYPTHPLCVNIKSTNKLSCQLSVLEKKNAVNFTNYSEIQPKNYINDIEPD
jgi:hypothetical protein